MSDNTIDTLQIEIESQSNNASASIDKLISALNRLSPALASAGTSGFKTFENSIMNAMIDFQRFRELLQTPIKLNIDTKSGDNISRMRSALSQAATEVQAETSKISSSLAESFNITSQKTIQEIDQQLQSIMAHFGESFKGEALKLPAGSLGNLTQSIAQDAKVAKQSLSNSFSEIENEYQEFYDFFKNKKLYISDFLKNDIGKTEFRDLLSTNLSNITKDMSKGIELNSIWNELSKKFPTIIPADTVNAADQVITVLRSLNDIRNQIKPVSIHELFGSDYENAIKNIRNSILSSINEAKDNLTNVASSIFNKSDSQINLDVQINEDKIVTDIQSAIKKASNVKYAPVNINLDADVSKIKNTLSEKLKTLEVGNIPEISNGIKSISNSLLSLNSLNLQDTGVNTVINSITRLNNAMANITSGSMSSMAQEIIGLSSSLERLNGIQFDSTGISNIAAAIGSLGRKTVTSATENIPSLTIVLKDFVQEMNELKSVDFDTSGLSELVSSITKMGSKSALASPANITKLADSLKQMMETLSTAPKVSQNLIQMTTAMGQLAKNGGVVSNMSAQVSNGFKSIGPAASGAKKHVFSLAAAFGKFYATYWLLLRALGSFKKAIDISSDLTEVQNVVDVTFGKMKQKAEDLAATSIQDFGMSELTTKQISSRFQAMGMAMGFAQDEMSNMSIELTKLAADMASFYNVEQEGVAKSLQSVFTGETEPLMLAA